MERLNGRKINSNEIANASLANQPVIKNSSRLLEKDYNNKRIEEPETSVK